MTFYQARDYSRTGLHIRRESWTDTWWILWRGLWWFFAGGVTRVVQAADYSPADLLADDWTTVPKALAACPIDSTIGSTGGAPPPPMSGGLSVSPPSADGTPSWLSAGGSLGGAGSSSGPGPVYVPPKNDGSITVQLHGVTLRDNHSYVSPDGDLDGSYEVPKVGPDHWHTTQDFGKYTNPSGSLPLDLEWVIDVTRTLEGKFSVSFESSTLPAGQGFGTDIGQPARQPIANSYLNPPDHDSVCWYGGNAKVL